MLDSIFKHYLFFVFNTILVLCIKIPINCFFVASSTQSVNVLNYFFVASSAQSVNVLNRKKVQDLLREIDPRETMDEDVEEV